MPKRPNSQGQASQKSEQQANLAKLPHKGALTCTRLCCLPGLSAGTLEVLAMAVDKRDGYRGDKQGVETSTLKQVPDS